MTTEQMDWLDDQRNQQEASANATPGDKTVPSKKKSKQKLLAQEQADQMPLSRAQLMMRDDILRSKDAEGRPNFIDPQVPLFDDELDDETPESYVEARGPQAIGQVLDAMMPHLADKGQEQRMIEVSKIAMEVITDGPRLELSLDQWQRVQALVEAAVRAGSDAEQSGRL